MILNLLTIVSESGETPSIFGIQTGVSFWTLVIFLLLSVLLGKLAYPKILGYAEAREKRIQDALDEARRQREETEQLLAQQREELNRARQEAQGIIVEGRHAADRMRDEILSRAKTEQEAVIERARQDIERERQRAIESLRREAVDLAIAAAGRLVGQRVDTDADRKLVTEYLKSVDSANGKGAN